MEGANVMRTGITSVLTLRVLLPTQDVILEDIDVLTEIIDEASSALRDAVNAAFDAGKAAGRAEALGELQVYMAGFFSDPLRADEATRPVGGLDVVLAAREALRGGESEGRASPGSVKPVIERMLNDARDGLTPLDVAQRSGFKYNSVRGTLWTLNKEGLAESRNGRWYALKNEAAVTPSGDETTASKSAEDAFGHIQQVQHPA